MGIDTQTQRVDRDDTDTDTDRCRQADRQTDADIAERGSKGPRECAKRGGRKAAELFGWVGR